MNEIENRIISKIKTGYYLELLLSETILLESTTTKHGNGENVSQLETSEVVLVHCNIVNSDYQQNLRSLYTFVPNKSLA